MEKKYMFPAIVPLWLLIAVCLLCFGCVKRESDNSIKNKLDLVVAGDLKAVVNELPKNSLADSVYTRIVEYKQLKKGMFRALAVVEYYYLRGVKVKRTVKYRYGEHVDKWERYSNEFVLY
jgi:hypothetical protein